MSRLSLALLVAPGLASPLVAQCESQHITPLDVFERSSFGSDVEVHGDVAVFASHEDDTAGDDAGAVYVFRKGAVWTQEAELVPADVVQEDHFGLAVSVSGSRLAASSRGNGLGGAAYVFHHDGSNWNEEAKLVPIELDYGDTFGFDLSLDGDRILVSAAGDDDRGDGAGAVYVFHFDGTKWNREAKLLAKGGKPGDTFGCSVSLRGDLAVIGARGRNSAEIDSGAAYVFQREEAGGWSQTARLLPREIEANAWFGAYVSTDGERVAVGGPYYGLNDTGAAFVFRQNSRKVLTRQIAGGGSLTRPRWVQEAMLTASDTADNDEFGQSIHLDGDLLLVGAPRVYPIGSVYLFHHTSDDWVEGNKLVPQVTTYGDRFGSAVATRGGQILVGDYREDFRGLNSGAAYAFARSTSHYGDALKGRGGFAPALVAKGCPTVGSDVTFCVSRGRGGAPGALVFGPRASLPFFGGTLLVSPFVLTIAHSLGGSPGAGGEGTFTTSVNLSDPSLAGLVFHAQALYLDGDAEGGHSMSEGLAVQVN